MKRYAAIEADRQAANLAISSEYGLGCKSSASIKSNSLSRCSRSWRRAKSAISASDLNARRISTLVGEAKNNDSEFLLQRAASAPPAGALFHAQSNSDLRSSNGLFNASVISLPTDASSVSSSPVLEINPRP